MQVGNSSRPPTMLREARWRCEPVGGVRCAAHAVSDLAEMQMEMKAVHVEFMVSPSMCRNIAFPSLCHPTAVSSS